MVQIHFVLRAQEKPVYVYPNRSEAAAFTQWLTHHYWDSIDGQDCINNRIGSPNGTVFIKHTDYKWWGQLADKFDSLEIAHFLMQIDSLNHNLGIPDTIISIDKTALDTLTAEEIFRIGTKLGGWNGAYETNPIYPEQWTHEFIDSAIGICDNNQNKMSQMTFYCLQEISYPIFTRNKDCVVISYLRNCCIYQTFIFKKSDSGWVLVYDSHSSTGN